eukprot:scaffold28446_cov45-Prasinocladus_malaysianus.AAC.2
MGMDDCVYSAHSRISPGQASRRVAKPCWSSHQRPPSKLSQIDNKARQFRNENGLMLLRLVQACQTWLHSSREESFSKLVQRVKLELRLYTPNLSLA